MSNLEELKNEFCDAGTYLQNYLSQKYPLGRWQIDGEKFIFDTLMPMEFIKFIWSVDERGFFTVNDDACKLTSTLDRVRVAREFAKDELDMMQRNIHQYYEDLSMDQDNEALQKFAVANEMSVQRVVEIYEKVEAILYEESKDELAQRQALLDT